MARWTIVHPAAEPAEHLPELEPDIAAAEHEQVLGHLVELHDGGGVERRDPVEAFDVWCGGRPPVLMKTQVGRELPAVHRHLAGGP